MEYLTRTEYAKRFGMSRQAVHQGIKDKRIPVVYRKVDQERIPVESVDDVKEVSTQSVWHCKPILYTPYMIFFSYILGVVALTAIIIYLIRH